MFSFFRRKKSQDEGDKRERSKSKEKSGSPFFKRKEHKKNDGSAPQRSGETSDKNGCNYSKQVDCSNKHIELNSDPYSKSHALVQDNVQDYPINNNLVKNTLEPSNQRPNETNRSEIVNVFPEKNAKENQFNGMGPNLVNGENSGNSKHLGGTENKIAFASLTTSVDNYSDTTVGLTVVVGRRSADPSPEPQPKNQKTDGKIISPVNTDCTGMETSPEIPTSGDNDVEETVQITTLSDANNEESSCVSEGEGKGEPTRISGGVDDTNCGSTENSPWRERRVGDDAWSKADIFEEVPSIDGVDVSCECPSNGLAPDDSAPLHSSSTTRTLNGEELNGFSTREDNTILCSSLQNAPVDEVMTYEIEERGKTDGIGDSGPQDTDAATDNDELINYGDIKCERVSDRNSLSKIEAGSRAFADFFARDKFEYENADVNGIDNTEIDATDIEANSENNSEAVRDGISEPSENGSDCCDSVTVSARAEGNEEGSGDYNANNGSENTCEAAVQIEKMSGVIALNEEDDRIVKRVRWADIEGGTELCCADSPSEYSTEDESSEEDEKQHNSVPEDPHSSSEEEESSESEAEDETVECKLIPQEIKAVEVKPENTSASVPSDNCSSSEEEEESSEEEEEESEDENPTNNSSQLKETTTEENKEEMSYRDGETSDLYNQIAELQHNLMAKTAGIERLQIDLETAYNESELARKRYRRLQDELEACKRCNVDLIDRLNKHAENASNLGAIEEGKLKEAEDRIKEIERKLGMAKEENNRLHSAVKKLEKERNEEMRIVQQALDDALEEQHKMEIKFGKEFEQLRTLNTNRELKLIDDFEWKLREVEKSCKKQIQDKEKLNEQKMAELSAKLSSAEAELQSVAHLKACDSELKQLRSITHDQKKSLRTLNRRLADIQVNEKVLQEETNRLRSALEVEKANFSAIQTLHKEDLAEKDRRLHFRLDMQKKHINAEWEEKLQRECTRLKAELEKTFRDEKRAAVESAKQMKEQENQQNRQIWEKRVQELLKEVESIKRKLAQKEENHKQDLENAQSKYDSDILELRRKMDKLDMRYQEQIEQMKESHEKELAKITEDCERKIQQTEANLHMQAGTTRTTLELVKQQMQKEAEIRLQEQRDTHQKELEEQWHRLMEEKERELKDVYEKHKETVEQFQNEIAALRKKSREENHQHKPSSSGLGKSLKGLFEKKDSSNQNHNETLSADQPGSVGNAMYVIVLLILSGTLLPLQYTTLIVLFLVILYYSN